MPFRAPRPTCIIWSVYSMHSFFWPFDNPEICWQSGIVAPRSNASFPVDLELWRPKLLQKTYFLKKIVEKRYSIMFKDVWQKIMVPLIETYIQLSKDPLLSRKKIRKQKCIFIFVVILNNDMLTPVQPLYYCATWPMSKNGCSTAQNGIGEKERQSDYILVPNKTTLVWDFFPPFRQVTKPISTIHKIAAHTLTQEKRLGGKIYNQHFPVACQIF